MHWKSGLSATLIALGAALALQAPAAADAWQPKRPVEVVVPSAPGGGQDLAARTLQGVMEQLQVSPKPIIVTNKPGGGGTVSIAYINTHEGDGDYSAVQALPLITNRLTGESEIGLADVTPIAQLLTEQVVFTVAADSPFKTGKDLAEAWKKDPQGVTIGVSSSPGGQSHIAAAMVLQALGLDPSKLKIVFFDSGGEAVTALMGGHIQASATPVPNVLGPVQAGKLRMVAVPAEHRLPGALSEVPTWKEQGVDAVFATWRVLVGPKGMSAEELAWWDGALGKVMASNEWKTAAERNLWTVDYKNSKDLKAFLDSENTRLAALLKELGLAKQ